MASSIAKYSLLMELGNMETDESFRARLTERSRSTATPVSGGKVRVKQAPREFTDINVMVRKWIKLGTPAVVSGREPQYGDFSQGLDYHDALTRLLAAQSDFMALPAPVRSFCQNDPGLFLELCSDPENLDRMRELGLVEARVAPAPVRVEVINPPVNPPEEGGGGAPPA